MKTTEVIIEAADPIGANKAAVENPMEAPNTGEGANKTIIGDNTKATVGNITRYYNNNNYSNYQGRGGHGHGGNNYRGHGHD